MAAWKTPGRKAWFQIAFNFFLQICLFCPLKVVRMRRVIQGFANTRASFQNWVWGLHSTHTHTQLQAYLLFIFLHFILIVIKHFPPGDSQNDREEEREREELCNLFKWMWERWGPENEQLHRSESDGPRLNPPPVDGSSTCHPNYTENGCIWTTMVRTVGSFDCTHFYCLSLWTD